MSIEYTVPWVHRIAELISDQTPNLDAFSRLRVSNPQTIFDSKQISDKQPLFWDDQEISGTGTSTTYNANQASTTIAVGASAQGIRVRQTFRRFNYQTGKSQLVILTGVIGSPQAGITRRVGQFDANNGYFFSSTEESPAVVIRTYTSGSPSDNIVLQADWNLDKLDGTGSSGVRLNLNKTNIYIIDYQWLGVGAVRFGVVIDGRPILCHQFNHANSLSLVYTSTPNLPLRYEIENDGTGPSASLTHICTSVITEGGRTDTGIVRGLNRADNTLITASNTSIYPMIGIRLKSTHLGSLVRYIDNTIICTSTAEYAWYVVLNPTVTGTTPTWNSLANSAIEYAYPTNETTISSGTVLYTGMASDTVQTKSGVDALIQSDITIGSAINGTPDQIYLGVQRLTGTTETFYASLNFSETN